MCHSGKGWWPGKVWLPQCWPLGILTIPKSTRVWSVSSTGNDFSWIHWWKGAFWIRYTNSIWCMSPAPLCSGWEIAGATAKNRIGWLSKTRAMVSSILMPARELPFQLKMNGFYRPSWKNMGFSAFPWVCTSSEALWSGNWCYRLEADGDEAAGLSALFCPESPWPHHQGEAYSLGFFIKNTHILQKSGIRRCPLTLYEWSTHQVWTEEGKPHSVISWGYWPHLHMDSLNLEVLRPFLP